MVVKLVRISISTGDELISLLNDEEKRLSVNELSPAVNVDSLGRSIHYININ